MADNDVLNTHKAVGQGDIELVKKCILQKHNIYLQNELGMNSLHLAVQKGEYEIAKLLIENGLWINSTCGSSKYSQTGYIGYTPLHFSSENGDEEMSKFLLSRNARPNIQEKQFGNTPLHIATLKGHSNIIRLLLENKYIKNFINLQNHLRESVLHMAVVSGSTDIIVSMLEFGADTKLTNNRGDTALHIACDIGIETTVQLLLRHSNKEVNVQNNKWCTPLHYAVRRTVEKPSKESFALLLLQWGADTLLSDEHGNTPLHYACESNHFDNIQLLITYGALVNARNFQEKTPLHVATEISSMNSLKLNKSQANFSSDFDDENGKIVDLLLQSDASLYSSDKLGNTPFHCATIYNNIKHVELFLEQDCSIINFCNSERKTALIIASENQSVGLKVSSPEDKDIEDRNTKVIHLLLKFKANTNLCDKRGNSALHYACINNDLEHVKLFLENGCDVNSQNNDGKTAINIAAQITSSKLGELTSEDITEDIFRDRNTNIVEKLLAAGANPNLSDKCGNTPLHYSCLSNNLELVKIFLENNCSVNFQNNNGKTALQIAAKYTLANVENSVIVKSKDKSKNTEIIKLLLENGANSYFSDEFKNTLLHCACISNNFEHVQLFLTHNFSVNSQNNEGKTALCIAAEYEFIEPALEKEAQSESLAENNQIIDILLEFGADYNITDELGNTPLHYACFYNKAEQVNVLLGRGCNVNIQNNSKKSALLIASDYRSIKKYLPPSEESAIDCSKKRNSKIIELLLEFKADTTLCDEFGNTPLHFSCINNNFKLVEIILNHGGNVNQLNEEGQTALLLATKFLSSEKTYCNDTQLNNIQILKRLLLYKASADVFDDFKNTPLHYACMNNNFEQVQLLLTVCSNINYQNINGKTALHISGGYKLMESHKLYSIEVQNIIEDNFKSQNSQIVKELLKAKPDARLSDEFGNTPLHYACASNNFDCVQYLIYHGCEINSKNNEGKSAFTLLAESQLSDLTSLFSDEIENETKSDTETESDTEIEGDNETEGCSKTLQSF